jgi:hypothetical protein
MIFFKVIILIFFFLVSNNVFAVSSLPDCANIANNETSEPGNNCNFYIDGKEMPICSKVPEPNNRINCINSLADLPSCLTFLDPNKPPKPLRNCIRIGDGKSIPTAPHDICEIDPNDTSKYVGDKKLNFNCVNLCYTKNPADGPDNCVERKYHHYLYKSLITNEPENLSYLNHRIASRDVSKKNRLQYSCHKLTAGELKYFNDEFNPIDCGKLREIHNGSVRIKRYIENIGPDNKPNTADDQFKNIDKILFSSLPGYTAKTDIADLYKPGEICRYRKCDNKFGINIIPSDKIEEQKRKNNSIQISRDIVENGNYKSLKNCSNNPNHSFISEDKIVCKNDKKCYHFTDPQITELISSPNAVEKCLAKSKDTDSIANCFLSLEPLKMCRLHSTIGPDCANTCNGSNNVEIPGINCFNDNYPARPMINCNYYSVIDEANYIDDSSVDWNLISNIYKNKFLKLPNPNPSSSPNYIEIPYTALKTANLAFNSQGQSPDYFKHDICNDTNNISECATDCNYVDDPNSQIAESCLERLRSKSVDLGPPATNPSLDRTNQEISHDIHNDINNDWFYRPYPLVDRCHKGKSGDCMDGNRQFRNSTKWFNIPWESDYNGSLFSFNNGQNPNDLNISVTPRKDLSEQDLLDHYRREDNNEFARGAYFHRLCFTWTNLKDLGIVDHGWIVLQTAAITAAATAAASVFIFCIPCAAATFIATFNILSTEFNLDKFISPKQCFAPRIHFRTNNLGSSAISGYNGDGSNDNDKRHYQSQYDEIDLTDNFVKTMLQKYQFMKFDPVLKKDPRLMIEFSSEDDFDQSSDRIIKDGILKKVIFLKDGYIKGDIVHDYSKKNLHQYRIRACMRFDGGARSCNVSCNLLGFCHKQKCGYDQCVDLYVTDDGDEAQYQCSAATKDGDGWRRKTDAEFRFPEDNYEGEDPNHPALMKNERKFCAKEITSGELGSMWSGSIRLRAVMYPDKYICVFADAAHHDGNPLSFGHDDNKWHVRGLIPVVSIPYKALPNLNSSFTSLHPRQFCLKYSGNIDNISNQNKHNCQDIESQRHCEPFLYAISDKKENIDNFIAKNSPLNNTEKSRHKQHKAEIFNDFKEILSIRSISNQYSKPSDNIYETDFFNPAILVNYGSELAMTSLPTGCIGGYKKFNTTNSKCQHISYTSDINFPHNTFSAMSFSENRKDIKQSRDGVLQLSANQYSDLTGLNYEKILYLKKGFSAGRPNVTLYKYNDSGTDNFLNQFTIYRKLPNYDNIDLGYDEDSGKFSIQLQNKKESDYKTRLPSIEMDVDPSNPNSNIESLTSGEKCFDLSSNDNRARLEYMKFCLKPDECSNLFDLCIANNLFASVQRGSLWNRCFGDDNNSLINKCSAKWGLDPAINDNGKKEVMNDMMDKIKSYRSGEYINNLYGWNHEICLDPKSYNQVKVAAYVVENNMGKCILDPVLHGNAVINNNGTPSNILDDTIEAIGGFNYNNINNCTFGSDKTNFCHCLKLTKENLGDKKLNFLIDNKHIASDEYYFRDATPRELGLCFDRELPLQCSSNKVGSGEYVERTTKTRDTHYAEYGHMFIPYSEFETGSIARGECKENWKVQKGVPMMRCIKNPSNSSEGKFEDIMLKINFESPINISGIETIISLLDEEELQDVELDMLFPSHIVKDKKPGNIIYHKIILNPDSDKEEVPIRNIQNQNADIDFIDNNYRFMIKNSDIKKATIINSIAINYSLQGRCVRPKCITDATSIAIGHPYYNIKKDEPEGGYYVNDFYSGSNLVDAGDNPIEANLPLKGSKTGYAYWSEGSLDIDAADNTQTIEATSCFNGFEQSSGTLPELTCSPEGDIEITSVGNACIRKECTTPSDLSPSVIDANIIENYGGVNFKGFDLSTNPLKSSRSKNLSNFDFSVTFKEERSSVTSQCYYNLSEGITYVKSSVSAPDPRLACSSDGNIVPLYANSCIKAGCDQIPSNVDLAISSEGSQFTYQGNNYKKPTIASYMKSGNSCSRFKTSDDSYIYINYPYNIKYKYSDIATLDRSADNLGSGAKTSLDLNEGDFIAGGTNPIRSCYITTSNSNTSVHPDWQGSDNPCVKGCIGASDFRKHFGSNTDSDNIPNITSGINYNKSNCSNNGVQRENCHIITINQDLRSTSPKEIIYPSGNKINIEEYRKNILITYPTKHNPQSEYTKILLFGDSSDFGGVDPSQTPSEISVINRINVGVTTHLVSSDNGKEIKIEWDNANFGDIKYAYFDFDPENPPRANDSSYHPFHCYDSSRPPTRINTGKHCDFYHENCMDKNGNKRANCGLIKFSTSCSSNGVKKTNCTEPDFGHLPDAYFAAGRNDGRFLLGRRCNNNGLWSEENIIIDNNTIKERIFENNNWNERERGDLTIASYIDPNNAANRSTALCAFKGNIADGLEVNVHYPMYENSIASSHKYLSVMQPGTDSEKNRIREGIGNVTSRLPFTITYPDIIDTIDGYSLADRDNNLPYSIKKCKYEDGHDGQIDKLSLYEYDENVGSDQFSPLPASAKKYCSPERLPSNIGDSTRSTTNQIFFDSSQSVTYDICPPNHTKEGSDPIMNCGANGDWSRNGDSNCIDQCFLGETWFNHGQVARRNVRTESCEACTNIWPFGETCDPFGGTRNYLDYATCNDGHIAHHRWNGTCWSNTGSAIVEVANIVVNTFTGGVPYIEMIFIPY